MLRNSLIDCIGHTPLVKLRTDCNVFAKLELLNPFGMKDRVAKQVLLRAKSDGYLQAGAPIVESSSGTMACGLALVGGYLGHPVHIVTDPRIDKITLTKLTSLGAEVHIVKEMQSSWQNARLNTLQTLLDRFPNAYWPRQYDNPDNPSAYDSLADELRTDLDRIDVLVVAVGSGGSLSGTARSLKVHFPELRVIAVDSVGSVLFGQPDNPRRKQSGLGNSIHPRNLDHAIVDEVHWLNDDEAFAATKMLAQEEKIFAGNSSGSVYAVARWLSTKISGDQNIVCILPDRGDRYSDTVFPHICDEKIGEPMRISRNEVADSWSYMMLRGL